MKAFSCENKLAINHDMTARDFDPAEALRVVGATKNVVKSYCNCRGRPLVSPSNGASGLDSLKRAASLAILIGPVRYILALYGPRDPVKTAPFRLPAQMRRQMLIVARTFGSPPTYCNDVDSCKNYS